VRVLSFFALEMFLYSGTEASIGTWIISVADESVPAASSVPELIHWSFYSALLAGRALGPVTLARLGAKGTHRSSLGMAVLAAVVALLGRSIPALWAAAVLAGFAFAPLFPIFAARLVEYTHERNPGAAGPVFAVAGFGAGALPWLAGRVVAQAGAIEASLLVPAVGITLLILTALVGPPARLGRVTDAAAS
jgi:fucose permease